MNKLSSLQEAIAREIHDGMSVVMGCGLESLIPFAAGYEIIRQKKKDLALIAPISDMQFDQIIGAGCVRKVIAAWVGNVAAGLGHNFRRAAEEGIPHPIEVEDHSNFTIALALKAAAVGLPFLPTKTAAGSDFSRAGHFKPVSCPFSGEELLAVRAIKPDVAILHVQRADPEGNAHIWGNLGVAPDAARAAKNVIIVAEEIVKSKAIASDPNRTVIPGFLVSAVAEVPFGAHPAPVQGYYNRDHGYYQDYHRQTKTVPEFQSWLSHWVRGVKDRQGYVDRLGDRVKTLKVRKHVHAARTDFGN